MNQRLATIAAMAVAGLAMAAAPAVASSPGDGRRQRRGHTSPPPMGQRKDKSDSLSRILRQARRRP